MFFAILVFYVIMFLQIFKGVLPQNTFKMLLAIVFYKANQFFVFKNTKIKWKQTLVFASCKCYFSFVGNSFFA